MAGGALGLGVLGCSDRSGGACGPVTREALDSAYLVHVLGDAEVEYTSHPPTSGPHQPAPAIEGVQEEPISEPVQVGVLERGDILLQHGPDLTGDDLAALRSLAGPGVVVATNPDLPDLVVATAWVHKQECDALDVHALEAFVDQRAGKGPE
jgi:hypothetical protein